MVIFVKSFNRLSGTEENGDGRPLTAAQTIKNSKQIDLI
jgi:hypothetical protein